MRKKAKFVAELENDDTYVEEPFALIDPHMVILHVDITFDDYTIQQNTYSENPQCS